MIISCRLFSDGILTRLFAFSIFIFTSLCIQANAEEPEEIPAEKLDFHYLSEPIGPPIDRFVEQVDKDAEIAIDEQRKKESNPFVARKVVANVLNKHFAEYQEIRRGLITTEDRFRLDLFYFRMAAVYDFPPALDFIFPKWKGAASKWMPIYAARERIDHMRRFKEKPAFPKPIEKILKDMMNSSDVHFSKIAANLLSPFFYDPVGKAFPKFPEGLTTTDGQPLTLERFRGKILLIDFWASWCLPCCRNMSQVIEAYNLFHGRGFEIIGISLDYKREDLEKYCTKNLIMWPQFFDGNGWASQVAVNYGVNSIPTLFLLGSDGTVLAGPNELREKPLKNYLDNILGDVKTIK